VLGQGRDAGIIDLGPMLDAMGQSALPPDAQSGDTTSAQPDAANQPVDANPAAPLPALLRAENAGDTAAVAAANEPVLLPFTTTPYTRIVRMSGEVGRSTLYFDVDDPAAVT